MAGTRWSQITSALVARMRATPGYRSPWSTTDSTSVPVFHSVELMLTKQPADKYLVIGWPGTEDSPIEAGTSEQTVGPVASNRAREELGVITCMAVAQSGRGAELTDGMVEAVLTDALAVVADVEANLRLVDGPTLGLSTPRLMVEMGRRMQFRPTRNEGVVWSVPFEIVYATRI